MAIAPPTRPGARVVVIGGGNGTSRLLAALKPLLADDTIASLHALVLNADDGGSTGRLRSQYSVAAVGDITRCLTSLSDFHGDIRGEEFLRALNYRFESGDFAGHTLRNIFLTSLEKTSDIDAAIAMMARILQIPKYSGVIPTTLQPLTQQVVLSLDGKTELLGEGQHLISHNVNLQADPRWQPGDVRVTFREGDVPLNPRAADALTNATHVIIAPGHTYGTIIPTLALPALGAALKDHPGQLIVVMTLLTTPRHTVNWSGEDFINVYQSYLQREPNAVIANTGTVDIDLVEGQTWVAFKEKQHPYRLIQADLVSTEEQSLQAGDTVPRAIVIHDPDKTREALAPLLRT